MKLIILKILMGGGIIYFIYHLFRLFKNDRLKEKFSERNKSLYIIMAQIISLIIMLTICILYL